MDDSIQHNPEPEISRSPSERSTAWRPTKDEVTMKLKEWYSLLPGSELKASCAHDVIDVLRRRVISLEEEIELGKKT